MMPSMAGGGNDTDIVLSALEPHPLVECTLMFPVVNPLLNTTVNALVPCPDTRLAPEGMVQS